MIIFFSITVSANRMKDNGSLGKYKIRERTKVSSHLLLIDFSDVCLNLATT